MTRWWMCPNDECEQYERVASADTAELAKCPACGTQQVLVSEDEEWEDQMTDTNLPKTEVVVPERTVPRPFR